MAKAPSLEELQTMIDEVEDAPAVKSNVVNFPKPKNQEWKEHVRDLLIIVAILAVGILIGGATLFVYVKINDTGCSKAVHKLVSRGYYTEARALEESYKICGDPNATVDSCLDLEWMKRHPAIQPWPKLPK